MPAAKLDSQACYGTHNNIILVAYTIQIGNGRY